MPSRRKRTTEYEERIRQASSILTMIGEDTTTPRNIRRAAKEALNMLSDAKLSQAVRAVNARSIMDDISLDPNMPPYTRTRIWNIVSLLEVVKE